MNETRYEAQQKAYNRQNAKDTEENFKQLR